MKVLHIVEAWKGGIASYVDALIKHQSSRGHTVHLLADSAELDSDTRNINIEIKGYQSSRSLAALPRIAHEVAQEIRRLAPDVVHCHSTFPGIYVRLLKHDCRVIYTPHAWSFFKQDVNLFHRLAYRLIERLMSRNCDKVICMSLEELEAAHAIGLDREKLALVYTGIPAISYHGTYSSNNGNDNNAQIKIGFFGRFDYQKGFDLIEDIAPLLSEKIQINLFGEAVRGINRQLDPRLKNHGWIDHDNIHEHMLSMDIILIPSRWEGFSLTPLEAMQAGRPVIVSNKSSLPEVVIHGFNGLVLPDYSVESLAELLNSLNKEDCLRMGKNAKLVFEEGFTLDEFADKIFTIYSS